MHQTGQLVDALKRVLKLKGITYADLAKAIDLSEASIKRIFADRSFTIKRLEQICQHLDISIYELAKLASQQDQPRSSTITMEQEAALAKNPVLLAVFYLLLNGWTPYRIKTRLAMNESQSAKALTSLQKLGLVERFSGNRYRTLTARTIAWRKSGPIRKLYEQRIKTEFLDTDFEGAGGVLRFATAELSASSMTIISRKIERLMKEFDELVELDMAQPPERKQAVGLLLAFRPWVFSLLGD